MCVSVWLDGWVVRVVKVVVCFFFLEFIKVGLELRRFLRREVDVRRQLLLIADEGRGGEKMADERVGGWWCGGYLEVVGRFSGGFEDEVLGTRTRTR